MKRRIAKLTGPKTFEFFEEDLPELKSDEILLKMVSAGLCHSDIPAYMGTSAMGRNPLGYEDVVKPHYPIGIGHEPTAVVEAVGNAVTKFKPGDQVTGVTSECMATHKIIREEERIIRVPEMDKPFECCLGEPMMCVANIVQAAKPAFGDHVAVIGCGFMGLLTIAGLKNYRLGSLTAVDLMDGRLAVAGEYGADHTVNPAKESLEETMMKITRGKGFDVIVEITGSLRGLASALSISRISGRGKILLPSMYTRNEVFTQKMAYHMMYRSPILHVVHPWYCEDYMDTLEKAVSAYKKGIFPTDRLITHRIPFEEISRGFELLENNPEEYVKGIIVFD